MQPTGDYLNILKIKPPMVTTRSSVDFFVENPVTGLIAVAAVYLANEHTGDLIPVARFRLGFGGCRFVLRKILIRDHPLRARCVVVGGLRSAEAAVNDIPINDVALFEAIIQGLGRYLLGSLDLGCDVDDLLGRAQVSR